MPSPNEVSKSCLQDLHISFSDHGLEDNQHDRSELAEAKDRLAILDEPDFSSKNNLSAIVENKDDKLPQS